MRRMNLMRKIYLHKKIEINYSITMYIMKQIYLKLINQIAEFEN